MENNNGQSETVQKSRNETENHPSKNSNKNWNLFDWLKMTHIHGWYGDLLKWLLLALSEPEDSPERININKGVNVLKKEMKELCDYEKIDVNLRKEILDFLES